MTTKPTKCCEKCIPTDVGSGVLLENNKTTIIKPRCKRSYGCPCHAPKEKKVCNGECNHDWCEGKRPLEDSPPQTPVKKWNGEYIVNEAQAEKYVEIGIIKKENLEAAKKSESGIIDNNFILSKRVTVISTPSLSDNLLKDVIADFINGTYPNNYQADGVRLLRKLLPSAFHQIEVEARREWYQVDADGMYLNDELRNIIEQATLAERSRIAEGIEKMKLSKCIAECSDGKCVVGAHNSALDQVKNLLK